MDRTSRISTLQKLANDKATLKKAIRAQELAAKAAKKARELYTQLDSNS